MKFGKGLLHEILQSNPEWAPFWLNYEMLKKRIKAVTRAAHHAIDQRDISESEPEVAFFRDLQMELKKISLFYAAEEKCCSFRYQQLRSVVNVFKKRDKIDALESQRLMFAFVHFYRECIRLENYAVINYQGFSKILKKHDKMTGYNTRSKYLHRKVNLSSFSSYPMLLQILSSTEEIFHEVECDARMAPAMSSMKFEMKLQGTVNSGSGRVPAPMVDISVQADSSASSPPSKLMSPRHVPSNTSAVATSFPASVLWTSDETTTSSNEMVLQQTN